MGKLSRKLYKLQKDVNDAETILSGSPKKIFMRFFVRKPIYRSVFRFLNKLFR